MSIRFAALVLMFGCGDDAATSGSGGGGAGGQDANSVTSTTSASGATTTSSSGTSSVGSGGGNGSKCANSGFTICESFEDAPIDGFPAGFGARGDEWGEGTIGVTDETAMRGTKALKANGGHNGQHFMEIKSPLGGLATHHFGRVFMKVAVPAPWPQSGVLHADFIEGLGPGPGGSNHNVRWGIVANTQMKFQWIYNVQPSNGAPEFAEGTSYDYDWSGDWQCIEWYYDQPTQTGTLWIDDVEMPIEPGANHAAEIPVFESLGVGLANYQDAGDGYTVYFDELAYHDQRIGCNN
jgi:hypothetical protein